MLNVILRNLLSNALKFSPEGKSVTIGARTYNNASLLIYVKDEGMGIARENIPKLFAKKQIFTTKGSANENGLGLGMVLCKDFVQRNGGNIWVESEEGKGTTVYFTLPGTN